MNLHLNNNKVWYRYIRDYIRFIGQQVLKPEERNIKLHFVFFPKEIERFDLTNKYAITIVNFTSFQGMVYCDMYFNVPKIYSYQDTNINSIDRILENIFYHEYRHYQQFKHIDILSQLEEIDDIDIDGIKEVLEKDANNYARMILNENKEIPIGVIHGVVRKMIKYPYNKNIKV